MSTPNKVAWAEDLYQLKPGDPPHAVENALAEVEGEMIGAIREIDANPLRPPTMRQTDVVISFIALQFVRDPATLAEFDRFTSDALGIKAELATTPERYKAEVRRMIADNPTLKPEHIPTYERFRQMLREGRLLPHLDSSYLVTTVLRSRDAVFKVLAGMQLTIQWVVEGEELVTASRPVVLIPARALPPFMPVGMATAEAVLMPLTPKLLFMALHREDPISPIALQASPGLVTKTNRLLAHQSKQVYSRTRFKLDPTQLDDSGGANACSPDEE